MPQPPITAGGREGSPQPCRKAAKFRKERDTALAELERVQKARSALELELQEHEKSCKNTHSLTRTFHYELLNCKVGLSEAKVECGQDISSVGEESYGSNGT